MKIGILGGGQLGRMLIQEALKYDDEWFTMDPAADAPCSTISSFTQGSFSDFDTVIEFAKGKDVVSIEIEHVNADALDQISRQGTKVIPEPSVIRMIQQKILQKAFYQDNNLPSPEFQIIQNKSEVNFPLPFVQKLNTGGYDGKGVQIIRTEQDLDKLWDEPSVLEKLVDIEKELAVIVAKNEAGETQTFPVTEMVADPVLNLLDFNVCPAEINSDVVLQIEKITETFLSAINSPGLFAIELFLDREGKVWVNETAPRTHNSGHQSQEGNNNSQFEQFYRVLKNLPLADTEAKEFSGMVNLIGAENHSGNVKYKGIEEVLKMPQTYIHFYGKTETRPGRKMGHVNAIASSREELLKKLAEIKEKIQVISVQ